MIVLTWLHREAPRHPPNPIGLHPVKILAVDGRRVLVDQLEVISGTPVLDVKPAI